MTKDARKDTDHNGRPDDAQKGNANAFERAQNYRRRDTNELSIERRRIDETINDSTRQGINSPVIKGNSLGILFNLLPGCEIIHGAEVSVAHGIKMMQGDRAEILYGKDHMVWALDTILPLNARFAFEKTIRDGIASKASLVDEETKRFVYVVIGAEKGNVHAAGRSYRSASLEDKAWSLNTLLA
jgi:hypothetical protein